MLPLSFAYFALNNRLSVINNLRLLINFKSWKQILWATQWVNNKSICLGISYNQTPAQHYILIKACASWYNYNFKKEIKPIINISVNQYHQFMTNSSVRIWGLFFYGNSWPFSESQINMETCIMFIFIFCMFLKTSKINWMQFVFKATNFLRLQCYGY